MDFFSKYLILFLALKYKHSNIMRPNPRITIIDSAIIKSMGNFTLHHPLFGG
jgi:hypothetical protein